MVEEILGSRGRIRVLQVLTMSGELNISEVSRRTGLNYTSVQRHLMKLKELGLLKEKRYGKIRIFEIQFRSLGIVFENGRPVNVQIQGQSPQSISSTAS